MMSDPLKAVGNGTIGVSVWWVNLPMIIQTMVSVATLIYIIIKITKEVKGA